MAKTAKTDPLVALGEAYQTALRADMRANERLDEAEGRVRDRLGSLPLCIFQGRHCATLEEVLERCRPRYRGGPSSTEGQLAWEEYQAAVAEYEARRRKLGLAPYDAEVKRTQHAWKRALGAIARTRAENVAGLAAKLHVIRQDFRDGPTTFSAVILRSAARDAARLAGKAVQR